MRHPSKHGSETGSLVIAVLIAAVLLVAFFMVFANWAAVGSKSLNHSIGLQKATYVAESGYYAAVDWLKLPISDSLAAGSSVDMSSLTPGTTYWVTLRRSPTDGSLVNITSTGYYEIPYGPVVMYGKHWETAVVDAQVRVEFIRDYFAAVPSTLQVAYGSDVTNGKVYGKDLTFMTGPVGSSQTVVQAAYYFNTVGDGTNFNTAPSYVTFLSPPNAAQKLTSELAIPHVAIMQEYYDNLARDPGGTCVLPISAGVCTLSGTWTPQPNPSNVCLCEGDLVLGDANPLTITGNDVIFAEGATTIMNTIQAASANEWLAVASEGDVAIDATAPATLSIEGTFVTDGGVIAQGNDRPAGKLTFTGGIVAQKQIELAAYKQSRVYKYRAADATMKLPFLVRSVAWTLRRGKYQ